MMNNYIKRFVIWKKYTEKDYIESEITFSIEEYLDGVTQVIELKPNGSQEFVKPSTYDEYVNLRTAFVLRERVHFLLEQFKTGLFDIIPFELAYEFNEIELQELIAGAQVIDVQEWKSVTIYYLCHDKEKDIIWFWEILEEFSQEQLRHLFSAVCGAPNPPFGGFKSILPPFQISRVRSTNIIPTTHTCYNMIDLPYYNTKEDLVQKLKILIENNSGFGTG